MNYFEYFNIPQKFIFEKEDINLLEEIFLSMQKNNYFSKRQDGTLNLAYNTISKEEKRLEHLMQIFEIKIENITLKKDLAEFIFNTREELEEASDLETADKLLEVQQKLDSVRASLDLQFKKPINEAEKDFLKDLFSEFKCLNEVVKAYKKTEV